MDEVGIREVRQQASELVRRAQAGERLAITVSGRPAAILGPITNQAWQTWDQVADIFTRHTDPDWEADRDRVDQDLINPWGDE